MKINILFGIMLMVFLFFGCPQQEKIKVTVKQIIPLTPGAFIEVAAPLDIDQSLDSLMPPITPPSIGDPEVVENSTFMMPIEIENIANEDFTNTKILFSYSSEYIAILYPYSWSKKPLLRLEKNTYAFDNDLKATQKTMVAIVGRVNNLPNGLNYGGVNFTMSVLDGNGNIIATKNGSAKIIKQK